MKKALKILLPIIIVLGILIFPPTNILLDEFAVRQIENSISLEAKDVKSCKYFFAGSSGCNKRMVGIYSEETSNLSGMQFWKSVAVFVQGFGIFDVRMGICVLPEYVEPSIEEGMCVGGAKDLRYAI